MKTILWWLSPPPLKRIILIWKQEWKQFLSFTHQCKIIHNKIVCLITSPQPLQCIEFLRYLYYDFPSTSTYVVHECKK